MSDAQQARQELMKYFDASILEKEEKSERTFLLFSDFINYSKTDITPFTGEINRDFINVEQIFYKMSKGYLVLDWDHGSCGGCPTQAIRMLIYGKLKELKNLDTANRKDPKFKILQAKCAKEVIEEMCDEMIYLETERDVLNYESSER